MASRLSVIARGFFGSIKQMNIARIVFSIAVALFSTSLQAQEEEPARSVSPDGKWEFRPGATEEAPDQRVFVIAKRGREEPSVVLSEEASGTFAKYAKVIWAPDSKRFAFNYQPGLRYQTAQFFQLDGDEWRELASPESDAVNAPINRSMAAQRKKLKLSSKATGRPISDGCQVRRWLDPNTVLLYAYSQETFEINNDLEQVGDSCFLTLKFDATGAWKIIRVRLLEGKAVAGLTKAEREELARLEKESEEEE
jgi:hypothetical protein